MKTTFIKTISILLIAIMSSCLLGCSSTSKYESNAISSAKSYVSSQFYDDFGIVADKVECDIIYRTKDNNDNPIHLVAVRCYRNSSAIASYCVYTKLGTFRDATQKLSPNHDFKKNINKLKAFFGVL